jgi:competence protein ComEC
VYLPAGNCWYTPRVLGKFLYYRFPRTLLVCLASMAFCAGLIVAQHARLTSWVWLWVLGMMVALTIWRRTLPALLLLLLLFGGLGCQRGSVVQRQLQVYPAYAKRKVIIVAQANIDAVYGKNSQLTFTADHARLVGPVNASLPGQITISGFGVPMVFRGDTVQVNGSLYPTRGNSQASVSYADIAVLHHGSSWLDSFRRRFAAGMYSALPEPAASFGLGLLIGQRNTLPDDVTQTLLVVGLTHVIAVSGYNLTIVVHAVRRLLGERSKFQITALCLALMLIFVLITGSSPSIVRAAIISVLSLLAWYYGRALQPLPLLLVAGAVSVAANPLYIWGNVSWYLSFLAFFGVLVIGPLVTAKLYHGREPPVVVQIVIESIAAEAMTVPYILYIFGQMSLVSLPANVLVVALVPLAMLLCLIAGLAGMLVPAVAGWVAWPAVLLLTYMLDAAQLLSRVPHAFVTNVGFPLLLLCMAYASVLLFIVALKRAQRAKYAIITEKIEGE